MGKKIIVYVILLLVVPMSVLTLISNIFYKHILLKRTSDMSQQNLTLISNNISTLVDNIIASSNVIANDEEIRALLFKGELSVETQRMMEKKIIAAQSSILYPYNTNMVVYDLNNHYYNSSIATSYQNMEMIVQQDWYQQTIEMNGSMNWCYPAEEDLNFDDYTPNSICMARMLKTANGKNCGILFIYVDLSTVQNTIFSNFETPYSGTFYVINTDGIVLMCSNASAVGSSFHELGLSTEYFRDGKHYFKDQNGSKLIIQSSTRSKGNYQVIHIIQEDHLFSDVNKFQLNVIIISFLFLIIFIGLTIIFVRKVTLPLTEMCVSMEMVADNDFSHKVQVQGNDEISVVAQHYNTMIEEVHRLLFELQRSYYQREELRYKALQNQINPHFILNTLNTIKLLVQMDSVENTTKIIVTFGKMLEHILNRNDEMISLNDELEYIKSYCTIQRTRYGNNFSLVINCDDDVYGFKVPCLILQPLIENAIIHGISEIQERGKITVSAFRKNHFVFIQINDNGIGISENHIHEILTIPTSSNVTGIGVSNVLERIKLLYGSDSGLSITNGTSGGTQIMIFLKENQEV